MTSIYFADILLKARAHKYVRRVPTGDPKRPWKYYYAESSAARSAQAGETVRLGDRKVKILDVNDEHVRLESGEILSHDQWMEQIAQHYSGVYDAAEKRARSYAKAVLRHVPRKLLEELQGATDAERMEDLRKREPQIYAKLKRAFGRTGMDPHSARRAISWALSRRGWSADARASLLGEMTVGDQAAYVQANYRRLGRAAENMAGSGNSVEPKHVSAVVSLPPPKRMDAVLAQAKKAAEAPAIRPTPTKVELLAQAMASAFPGMAMDEVIQLVQATQAAREAEAKAPPPSPDGALTSVFLPGEDGAPERLNARYKLVEADELIASHNPDGFQPNEAYPQGLQERAYHRDKAEQTKVLSNAQNLIPEFVANTNPDAVNGAPLVQEDGTVLGGNSRTMSMQLAYKNHPEKARSLKAYLSSQAASFGLREQDVEAMQSPVLVRVVDTANHDPKLLVRTMNESMTQEMDPRTMQVALGRKMDARTLGILADDMNPDETLGAFLNDKRSEGFVNQLKRVGVIDRRNQSRYMDTKGNLNQDGKTLVERVLVGKMIGDPDLLSDTQPKIVSSLARAVPYMIQAEDAGPGFRIQEDLKIALEAHNDMRRRSMAPAAKQKTDDAIREYLGQVAGGINDKNEITLQRHPLEDSPRAHSLLKILYERSGSQQMANVFREYADQAKGNREDQGGFSFTAKTPDQVFESSIKAAVDAETKKKLVAEAAARAEKEAKAAKDAGEAPPSLGLFASLVPIARRRRL